MSGYRAMAQVVPSQTDVENLTIIRNNVVSFMKHVASRYARSPGLLLDIAPQNHEGARPFFSAGVAIETLDIDPASDCTHIGDICQHNALLAEETYDFVVCTEVLEHTRQPFGALDEIWRVLKPGGLVFVSTPFNFRIHGPLPDCWRFTEHGLRVLLERFEIVELNSIETPERPLMPVQYTVVARKPLVEGPDDNHHSKPK